MSGVWDSGSAAQRLFGAPSSSSAHTNTTLTPIPSNTTGVVGFGGFGVNTTHSNYPQATANTVFGVPKSVFSPISKTVSSDAASSSSSTTDISVFGHRTTPSSSLNSASSVFASNTNSYTSKSSEQTSASSFSSVFRALSPHRSSNTSNNIHQRKISPSRTAPVCHHYTAGMCRKGELCEFRHPSSSSSSSSSSSASSSSASKQSKRLCTFYAEGRCTKGAACLFRHGDKNSSSSSTNSSRICTFFQQGRCRNGNNCSFVHEIVSRDDDDENDDDDDEDMSRSDGVNDASLHHMSTAAGAVVKTRRLKHQADSKQNSAMKSSAITVSNERQHREISETDSPHNAQSINSHNQRQWSIVIADVPLNVDVKQVHQHLMKVSNVISVVHGRMSGQYIAKFSSKSAAIDARRLTSFMGTTLTISKPHIVQSHNTPEVSGGDAPLFPLTDQTEVDQDQDEDQNRRDIELRRTRFQTSSAIVTIPNNENIDDGDDDERDWSGLDLIGAVTTMCPIKEIEHRMINGPFSSLFESSGSTQNGRAVMDATLVVKQFQRPAAGIKPPTPETIRTPLALAQTLFYLSDKVLMSNHSFDKIYNFLRDRIRSIRQDFSVQRSLDDDHSCAVYECAARFHIMSHHELCELPSEDFDANQNMNMISKTLVSLLHIYEDARLLQKSKPFESEFQAYMMLANISNGDRITAMSQHLPPSIIDSPAVSFALNVYRAYINANYTQFFLLVRKANYLQKCMLHARMFGIVREMALERVYRCMQIESSFPIASLVTMLGFNDDDEAKRFAKHCNLAVNNDDDDDDDDDDDVIIKNKGVSHAFLKPSTACARVRSTLIGAPPHDMRTVVLGASLSYFKALPPISSPSSSSSSSSSSSLNVCMKTPLKKNVAAPHNTHATHTHTISTDIVQHQRSLKHTHDIVAASHDDAERQREHAEQQRHTHTINAQRVAATQRQAELDAEHAAAAHAAALVAHEKRKLLHSMQCAATTFHTQRVAAALVRSVLHAWRAICCQRRARRAAGVEATRVQLRMLQARADQHQRHRMLQRGYTACIHILQWKRSVRKHTPHIIHAWYTLTRQQRVEREQRQHYQRSLQRTSQSITHTHTPYRRAVLHTHNTLSSSSSSPTRASATTTTKTVSLTDIVAPVLRARHAREATKQDDEATALRPLYFTALVCDVGASSSSVSRRCASLIGCEKMLCVSDDDGGVCVVYEHTHALMHVCVGVTSCVPHTRLRGLQGVVLLASSVHANSNTWEYLRSVLHMIDDVHITPIVLLYDNTPLPDKRVVRRQLPSLTHFIIFARSSSPTHHHLRQRVFQWLASHSPLQPQRIVNVDLRYAVTARYNAINSACFHTPRSVWEEANHSLQMFVNMLQTSIQSWPPSLATSKHTHSSSHFISSARFKRISEVFQQYVLPVPPNTLSNVQHVHEYACMPSFLYEKARNIGVGVRNDIECIALMKDIVMQRINQLTSALAIADAERLTCSDSLQFHFRNLSPMRNSSISSHRALVISAAMDKRIRTPSKLLSNTTFKKLRRTPSPAAISTDTVNTSTEFAALRLESEAFWARFSHIKQNMMPPSSSSSSSSI